ncbi:hypothetical protein pb186bvf_019470 [Paramecium bursaria]
MKYYNKIKLSLKTTRQIKSFLLSFRQYSSQLIKIKRSNPISEIFMILKLIIIQNIKSTYVLYQLIIDFLTFEIENQNISAQSLIFKRRRCLNYIPFRSNVMNTLAIKIIQQIIIPQQQIQT